MSPSKRDSHAHKNDTQPAPHVSPPFIGPCTPFQIENCKMQKSKLFSLHIFHFAFFILHFAFISFSLSPADKSIRSSPRRFS
jgi:hypothetical protein